MRPSHYQLSRGWQAPGARPSRPSTLTKNRSRLQRGGGGRSNVLAYRYAAFWQVVLGHVRSTRKSQNERWWVTPRRTRSCRRSSRTCKQSKCVFTTDRHGDVLKHFFCGAKPCYADQRLIDPRARLAEDNLKRDREHVEHIRDQARAL